MPVNIPYIFEHLGMSEFFSENSGEKGEESHVSLESVKNHQRNEPKNKVPMKLQVLIRTSPLSNTSNGHVPFFVC